VKIKRINIFSVIGGLLIAAGLFIVLRTYLPILTDEVNYQKLSHSNSSETGAMTPLDTDFGILIPKLNANAHVIKNVDPYNSEIYQSALARGVAHAKGTSLPGQDGNVFLFSHSSSDFLHASRYNSIFYLLNKLDIGDEIKLYYEQKQYVYKVNNKVVVNPDSISYLQNKTKEPTLTLMTCWPPGTSIKRLVIEARLTK